MLARLSKSFAAVALAALAWLPAFAQALQPVPPLTGRVVDLTGTLAAPQTQALEAKLRDFEQRKGSQVVVLIVPRTAPETIEQYGIRVAEQWKPGRGKVDDGAILLVAREERALRIEVGYGLEGALNDATARRIVDEVIVPRFRDSDFAGGIEAGTDAILRVIDGEPLPESAGGGAEDSLAGLLPLLFFGALAVGGVMRALLGRGKGALATGGLLGIATWLLSGALLMALVAAFIGLVVTLGGGQMGSGWRGGPRMPGGWGGGGWGSGGGGFRGGGGGFGGGGASGRW